MGRSVTTLLELARLETGAETFLREEVDLAEPTHETLRSPAPVLRERDLRVEEDFHGDAHVENDGDVLRIVVSNLLGNATHHAPRGGRVACRLLAPEARVVVQLERRERRGDAGAREGRGREDADASAVVPQALGDPSRRFAVDVVQGLEVEDEPVPRLAQGFADLPTQAAASSATRSPSRRSQIVRSGRSSTERSSHRRGIRRQIRAGRGDSEGTR